MVMRSQGREFLSRLYMPCTARTQKIWELNKLNGSRVEEQLNRILESTQVQRECGPESET